LDWPGLAPETGRAASLAGFQGWLVLLTGLKLAVWLSFWPDEPDEYAYSSPGFQMNQHIHLRILSRS
jgi:hypothetical protein